MFIVVKVAGRIPRAVMCACAIFTSKDGEQVRVYMNCESGGPTIDAVVELF